MTITCTMSSSRSRRAQEQASQVETDANLAKRLQYPRSKHRVLKLQVPSIAGTDRMTFEIVDVRYPLLSVAMFVASGHKVIFRGQEAELSTARGAVAPLTRMRGLWYLMVWINHRREFVLVDSGSACHVCQAAWVQRLSAGNKQFQSLTITTEPGELAPIAEDVRDPGPHPVRQNGATGGVGATAPLSNA